MTIRDRHHVMPDTLKNQFTVTKFIVIFNLVV